MSEDLEQLEFLDIVGGNKRSDVATMENSMTTLKRLNMRLPHVPAIEFLHLCTKALKAEFEVSLQLRPLWHYSQQPKAGPMAVWVSRTWYTQAIEYCSAMPERTF